MAAEPSGTAERTAVVGIGLIVHDLTLALSRWPARDEKLAARACTQCAGGPVPTALVTLARLGVRCAFGGVVGDDEAGRSLRADLEGEGVDCAGMVEHAGLRTPHSVVLTVGAERTIIECGQSELPAARAVLEGLGPALAGTRLLHVDGRLPAVQTEAARRVRAAGGWVSVDGSRLRPGLAALLPLTDVAIVPRGFAASVPDAPAEPEAFAGYLSGRLAPDGPRIAGVTLGAEGCVVRAGDEAPERIAAHPVEVCDSTGAGDVFHGAFLAALLGGEPWRRAAHFANAAAALSCLGPGARAPLPARGEIAALAMSSRVRGA